MYNVSTNFCQLMGNSNALSFQALVINAIMTRSNLNHTCPYNVSKSWISLIYLSSSSLFSSFSTTLFWIIWNLMMSFWKTCLCRRATTSYSCVLPPTRSGGFRLLCFLKGMSFSTPKKIQIKQASISFSHILYIFSKFHFWLQSLRFETH